MALRITPKPGTTPSELLEKIISDVESKKFEPWSYSSENGFAHTAVSGKWNKGLKLKPRITDTWIELLATPTLNAEGPDDIYGVLHGHFVELIVNYYTRLYDKIEIKDTRDEV